MASTKPDLDIVSRVPSKVWEQIFQHVSVLQLLELRLTCRSWRTIVDGCPALMKRIRLKFPNGFVLDRDFKPKYLVPARNVSLDCVQISAVDSWWLAFGKKVVDLSITNCNISFPMLLEVLKPMENLKNLQLNNFHKPKSSRLVVNLDLSHVESLKMADVSKDNLACLLPLFTQLKWIDLPAGIEIINKLKDSLEGITIDYDSTILKDIIQLKHLTHLTVRQGAMTNQDLNEIGKALPKLKYISIYLSEQDTSFTGLSLMTELEYIFLKASCGYIYYTNGQHFSKCLKMDLGEAQNYKLINFKMSCINPSKGSLYKYLDNSPNIINVALSSCKFDSWYELFDALELFCATLQRLTLDSVMVTNADERFSVYFDGLKYLNIRNCKIPKKLLIKFISLCPQLEEIHLASMSSTLDDEVVLVLSQKLKHLEKLTLIDCRFITDTSADYIVGQCHALRQLTVRCTKMSDVAKNKLKNMKFVRCLID